MTFELVIEETAIIFKLWCFESSLYSMSIWVLTNKLTVLKVFMSVSLNNPIPKRGLDELNKIPDENSIPIGQIVFPKSDVEVSTIEELPIAILFALEESPSIDFCVVHLLLLAHSGVDVMLELELFNSQSQFLADRTSHCGLLLKSRSPRIARTVVASGSHFSTLWF